MSTRTLPNWIESYMEYTENTEPPRKFRQWMALSTIASVLQRKCVLHWGTETFYPNMYIVLVGPPAARKGTAMRAGRDFLDNLGISVASDESSRQKLIKTLQESGVAEQAPDGSINWHSSLTIHSSELTVFLGYGARELLSMLCKWYDCEARYTYDTHARGKEEVPNVWVHLLGATTPGQLRASLPEDAVGSGFTSRVVFVYEEKKEKTVRKPDLSPEQVRIGELLEQDLSIIRNMAGEFTTTLEYEEAYYDWYEKSEERSIFTDPRLEYYVQRRPTHLFKLTMLCCAARGDAMLLELRDMEQGIQILTDTERKMPKVFAGVGANPLAHVQAQILKLVQEAGAGGIPMSEVYTILSDDASHSSLMEAVQAVEAQGKVSSDIVNKRLYWKGS